MQDYCGGNIIYLIYEIDETTRETEIEERQYHNTAIGKLMKQSKHLKLL